VAHVVSSLEIGGQERVVLDLARGLSDRGHTVTVIALSEGGALRSAFGSIPTLSVARSERGGADARLLLRLRRLLRELAPQVVHTHNPAALLYACPAARAAGRFRIVHTKHGANPDRSARALLARRVLLRWCDEVVAVSEETAEMARRRDWVPERRLHVIPNGVDVDAFARDEAARARVRAELAIGPDVVVVGTVGRLAPEKNQRLLVDAASALLGPRVHLVVVGDGPLRDELERSVPPGKRAWVRFTGARTDVSALLSAFDVFALSSTTEGLPLVVPEAMAAALPIVCTAVGGLPGVVREGITGRLVPSGDAAALRRALGDLLDDPRPRARLGRAARDAARERFAMDRMVEAYLALYRGI
jgi:sugar transferase (PEP-CTERM/EpsH1 system associated)